MFTHNITNQYNPKCIQRLRMLRRNLLWARKDGIVTQWRGRNTNFKLRHQHNTTCHNQWVHWQNPNFEATPKIYFYVSDIMDKAGLRLQKDPQKILFSSSPLPSFLEKKDTFVLPFNNYWYEPSHKHNWA